MRWLALVVLLILGGAARADTPSPWADPRLATWSQAYRDGKLDAVIAAVERDLKSAHPHPFAAHVWVVTQDGRGTLAAAVAKLDGDQALKAALGVLPDVYAKFEAGNYRELLDAYPPKRTAELHDYWTLTYLTWSATQRPYTALDYEEQKLLLVPDFMGTWDYMSTVTNQLDGDPAVMDRARKFVTQLPKGACTEFLSTTLRYAHNDVDELAAVASVRRAQPWDSYAMRFEARLDAAWLGDHTRAAELLQQAGVRYPWKETSAAMQLVLAGKRSDADSVIAQRAKRGTRSLARDQWIAHQVIQTLMDSGEKGQAKSEIDRALASWPRDAFLYDQLAQYWTSPLDLAPARKAVELEPTPQRREALVQALLSSGELKEAQAVYETLVNEGHDDLGAAVYAKLGQPDARLRLAETRANAEPQDTTRLRELAQAQGQAGHPRDAAATLLRALAITTPDGETFDLLTQWDGFNSPELRAHLEQLHARYPWHEQTALALIDFVAGADRTARIAHFSDLEAAVPARAWPWHWHVTQLVGAQRWDEAARLAERARTALASAPIGDRAQTLLTSVFVVDEQAEHGPVPPARLEQALDWVRQYEALRGDLDTTLREREGLLVALQRTDAACDAAVKRSANSPDDVDLWWHLLERCPAHDRDRIAAKRFIDRAPDEPRRLENLIRATAQRWNAPVLALGYIDRLRRVAPQVGPLFDEGLVLAQLGDSRRAFALQYDHAPSLGDSDRYLKWYDDGRRRAEESKSNNLVDYDASTQSARITYPTGEVVIRREHPISGNLVELRRGSAIARATYDASGVQLQRIEEGGRTTVIKYDGRGLMTKATSIIAGQEVAQLSFVFDDHEHPIRIELRDEIDGTSDALSLLPVTAKDIPKLTSASGRKASLRVTTAFESLRDRIRKFDSSSGQSTAIAFPDIETATLATEYREQKARATNAHPGDKDRETAKLIDTELQLARRLVEQAPSNTAYDQQASKLVDDLVATGQHDARYRQAAITAIGVYDDLLAAMRPNGVEWSELVTFGERVAWLRSLSAEPQAAAAKKLLEQIEAHGVEKQLVAKRLQLVDEYARSSRWSIQPLSMLPTSAAPAKRATIEIDGRRASALVDGNRVMIDVGGALEPLPLDAAIGHELTGLVARADDVIVVARDAIFVRQASRIVQRVGRIDALLTIASRGITLATSDGKLFAVGHATPGRLRPVETAGLEARFLARGPDDESVVVAGDKGVGKLDVASGRITKLFDVHQTVSDDNGAVQGPLTSVLVASDGSVWATAGSSLLHWNKGAVDEFSIYKDATRFPVRSDMLSRVIETVDHRIWVVASNEQHRSYRELPLVGGLYELDGDRFRQVPSPGSQWFITGYTPISATEAIVGSTHGFALQQGRKLASFYDDAHTPSYIEIVDNQKRGLFLGTRGVAIGTDTWLFGSAGGIVAYTRRGSPEKDRWMLLEEVNALLPDPELLDRGGRCVHAIETDSDGRLYIGTDRGLVIIDGGLAGVESARAADLALAPQVDSAQLQAKLGPDQALVRYRVVGALLLAEVIDHEHVTVRHIPVPGEPLEQRARRFGAEREAAKLGGVRAAVAAGLTWQGHPRDREVAALSRLVIDSIKPLVGGKRTVYVEAYGGLGELPWSELANEWIPRVPVANSR